MAVGPSTQTEGINYLDNSKIREGVKHTGGLVKS